MSDDLTLEAARAMDSEALRALADRARAMGEEGIRLCCIAWTELEDRGEAIAGRQPEWARHARAVAEGRLTPRAAENLAGLPVSTFDVLMTLPADLQDRLADGEKVKVAVRKDGRVVSAEKAIHEMTGAEIGRAFRHGHVIDWMHQGEALNRAHNAPPEGDAPKRPMFSINRKTGKPRVMRTGDFEIEDLIATLAALGMQVKPIYGKPLKPAPGA